MADQAQPNKKPETQPGENPPKKDVPEVKKETAQAPSTVPASPTPAKPEPASSSGTVGSPAQPEPVVPVTSAPAKPEPASSEGAGDAPAQPPKPAAAPPGTGSPAAPPEPAKTDGGSTRDLDDVALKSRPANSSEPVGTRSIKPLEPAPAAAKPATAGTVCPTCGHRNRPGILICENCGTNLVGRAGNIGTRDLKREEEAHSAEGEKLLDTGQSKALDSAGSTVFMDNMVLRIEIEGGSTPMLVYPKQEIILGRRDPNTGGMPDVDLTAYAGYRMGVSRRHAAIRLQEKHLHVSDLGSSNGTFLNGTRLAAHRPYQLRDGDEVRLGQMVLKLYFQASKGPR